MRQYRLCPILRPLTFKPGFGTFTNYQKIKSRETEVMGHKTVTIYDFSALCLQQQWSKKELNKTAMHTMCRINHIRCAESLLQITHINQNLTKNETFTSRYKQHLQIITVAASSGKHNKTVWRPSICLSHQHTHRDSPEGSMRRGQHTFRPTYVLHPSHTYICLLRLSLSMLTVNAHRLAQLKVQTQYIKTHLYQSTMQLKNWLH